MTIQTTTPATLGWMINVFLLLGWALLGWGVYLVFGMGWAAIVCGLCFVLVALYVTRLCFWSMSHVRTPIKPGSSGS